MQRHRAVDTEWRPGRQAQLQEFHPLETPPLVFHTPSIPPV